MIIPKRNIALCIIFTLVTCGLYGLYWFVCLTNEVNTAAKSNGTTGGMALILTFITCGIYGIFWAYKQGEKIDEINGTRSSNSILYLILSIFGFGIIGYCLMQNELNKLSDQRTF